MLIIGLEFGKYKTLFLIYKRSLYKILGVWEAKRRKRYTHTTQNMLWRRHTSCLPLPDLLPKNHDYFVALWAPAAVERRTKRAPKMYFLRCPALQLILTTTCCSNSALFFFFPSTETTKLPVDIWVPSLSALRLRLPHSCCIHLEQRWPLLCVPSFFDFGRKAWQEMKGN